MDIKKRASGGAIPLKALVFCTFPCIKDSVYIDDGCSGTNCNRPGFQRMLSEIEAEYRNHYRENYCEIIGLNQKDLENQGILA